MKKNEKEKISFVYYTVKYVIQCIHKYDIFNIKTIRVSKFLNKLNELIYYVQNNFNDSIIKLNEKQQKGLEDVINRFQNLINDYKDCKNFVILFFEVITDVINGKLEDLWSLYNTFDKDTLYKIML